ncbi:MAG: XRE family transcriptional regulator [Candidatus Omnitrophota bacterium]|nr:XRE family transcriptional regulator [Candidatus Omnitrophota bacterium]
MKLHEKIKRLRQEKNLSLSELHRMIVNDFKEGAVTYRTLQRIESGDTDGRGTSLHQICTALNITQGELRKDTEEEHSPVDLIKKNGRLGKYVFNGQVYAELLIRQNRNFMVQELVLKPQGKTGLEQDPALELSNEKVEQIKEALKGTNFETQILGNYNFLRFEKYVYCLKGSASCYIGKDKYILTKGYGLSFESSLPHWFENTAGSTAHCLIFQNPRSL